MTIAHIREIALLLLEASVVSFLLLVFFRLRKRFGLALLCVTLGSFQYLQTELAATLFVEIWPGMAVSPGSTVLFMATLFATLLVYIRDDAIQARSLIAGIVAANLTLGLVIVLTDQHVGGILGAAVQPSFNTLAAHLKALVVGTTMLCVDAVLIIVLYEFFYRIFRHSLFSRIAMSMVCIAMVDTLAFVGLSFYGNSDLGQMMIAGIVGKSLIGMYYAVVMAAYLRLFRPRAAATNDDITTSHDIFHILTYRQRYELLKDELTRDPMTGLFNRRFFDENLRLEIERAARLGHRLGLMLLDLDNFKNVNDRYGHQVGDKVIQYTADGMQEVLREADVPCRYGGEEFAIIMPDTSVHSANNAARRLSRYLLDRCVVENLPIPANAVTFTAGIAYCPDDAMNSDSLLEIADRRLYQGKRGGRNQVVDRDTIAEAAATGSFHIG